jgi:hypothetical protein
MGVRKPPPFLGRMDEAVMAQVAAIGILIGDFEQNALYRQ